MELIPDPLAFLREDKKGGDVDVEKANDDVEAGIEVGFKIAPHNEHHDHEDFNEEPRPKRNLDLFGHVMTEARGKVVCEVEVGCQMRSFSRFDELSTNCEVRQGPVELLREGKRWGQVRGSSRGPDGVLYLIGIAQLLGCRVKRTS